MQQTLSHIVEIDGTGLHSGERTRLRICPSDAETGIQFLRTDVTDRDPWILARFDNVTDTRLNTTLSNAAGVSVSTVEHLLAALAGLGIHNAIIEIDGGEVPILDGSSLPFARKIVAAGRHALDAPLEVIEVLKPVEVTAGAAFALLRPSEAFRIDFTIDFTDGAIGRQKRAADFGNGQFLRDYADCRTFCRSRDVDAMRAAGLARGGSFENAVVVDGDRVLSPNGFRRADECVRHKMLDALGDLSLAGMPMIGTLVSERGGHSLTNQVLRKLMETPGAMRRRTALPEELHRLPGMELSKADLASVA